MYLVKKDDRYLTYNGKFSKYASEAMILSNYSQAAQAAATYSNAKVVQK